MLKWKWEKGRTKISRDNLVKKLSKYGVPTIQGYQPPDASNTNVL